MKNIDVKWKKYFLDRKEIILCTASKKGLPNGIIVISQGFIDGGILIADCQMENTIKNLKENKKVCLIGGYFKILGKAKVYKKGKYFDLAVKKSPEYKVKNAVIIKPDKLIDLDKIKILKLE
jgi:hypothetical protein